jgi:hypothetical protein
MKYLLVAAAALATTGMYARAGATEERSRQVRAWFWLPAAAILAAGWIQAPRDLPFGEFLLAVGVCFVGTWTAEMIHPTVNVTVEDVPCPKLLPPNPRPPLPRRVPGATWPR